jgi:hypothetical protein
VSSDGRQQQDQAGGKVQGHLKFFIRSGTSSKDINSETRQVLRANQGDGVDQADSGSGEVCNQDTFATWIRSSTAKREAKGRALALRTENKHIEETKPLLDHHLLWLGKDRAPSNQRKWQSTGESSGDDGCCRSSAGRLSMRNERGQSANGLQNVAKAPTTLQLDVLFVAGRVGFGDGLKTWPVRGGIGARGEVFKGDDGDVGDVGDGTGAVIVFDSEV